MTCYDIPRGNGKTLEDIINDFSKVLADHRKKSYDPHVLQVGDITPRLRPILEDLRALEISTEELDKEAGY